MAIPPEYGLIDSALDFLSRVEDDIGKGQRELTYFRVPAEWRECVIDELDNNPSYSNICLKHYDQASRVLWVRLVPQEIHTVQYKWWHDQLMSWIFGGLVTEQEVKALWPDKGATMSYTVEPHSQISCPTYPHWRDDPGLSLRSDGKGLPGFVMQSGWSEAWNQLMDNMNLWLLGGNEDVRAVLLLKWKKIGWTNRVTGDAEIYSLDANGLPVLAQSETTFPAPSGQGSQYISLSRVAIFGSYVPDANSNDMLSLSIDGLRKLATQSLASMDLVPA